MDNSQTMKHKDARKSRTQSVTISFTDEHGFLVLNQYPIGGVIELKNIKYFGYYDPEGINSRCTCASFFYGMRYDPVNEDGSPGESNYVKEHGIAFECKHLMRAAEMRITSQLTCTKIHSHDKRCLN